MRHNEHLDDVYITMVTRAANGGQSIVGYDGHQFFWYTSGDNQHASPPLPPRRRHPRHTGDLLARPCSLPGPRMRLVVAGGQVEKVLALDRRTGVVLGMTTWQQHRKISEMQVQHIDYHAVAVTPCDARCAATSREAGLDEISRRVGEKLLLPAWLPAGLVPAGQLVGPCPLCGHPMAVRYSDGLTTITLFEMPWNCGCCMGQGCFQSAGAHDLVLHYTGTRMAVTLVGNLDRQYAERVLKHLQ